MSTENVEHKVNRDGWPSGPWDSEPDREEWRAHGFPCLIVRNQMGALCGYVGLPPGHEFHGKGYDDIPYERVECHGGLTYANACAGHICHIPREGEPAEVWWLGFDCNHFGDVAPSMLMHEIARGFSGESSSLGESYKTIGYVRREVEQLAKQLSEAA